MDMIFSLISELTQSPDQFRMVFIVLVTAAVFLFGLGIVSLINALRDPIRARLQEVGESSDEGSQATGSLMVDSGKSNPLAPYILPKKETERSKIAAKLIIAGYRSPSTLVKFYMLKTVLAVALPVIVVVVTNAFWLLPASKMFVAIAAAAFVGIILPNYVLGKKVKGRQKKLRNAFPDALDLLVVCIEAGLGLNAAIQRVAREISASYPDLSGELGLVNAEIRGGVERSQALRNLADRTGLVDIRGLVSLLSQSLRFGTSVAEALRVYAEEFRDKRMQMAEEQAAKIGTKMIFPLVLCLFPSFFLVAVGPAILRIMDVFTKL